ncbi:MAG: hypothetical protein Aureis2KO_12410 [Aureisphaera sp.]
MDKDQDYIERYLDGELNPEEAKAFMAQLSEDDGLKEALEEAQAARNAILAAGRLELKETLESFESDVDSTTLEKSQEVKVVPLWIKRVIPIAAMIVVFVGAYWFLLGEGVTSNDVYTKYYEVYEAPSALRDSGADTPLHWNTGVRYYSEGRFEEALRNFSKSESEIPEYLIDFYSGVCAMSKSEPDYKAAVNHFLDVEKRDNDYRQQAKWYRGLALLKQGEKDKALAIFHDISETKGYRHKEARKIIGLTIED